MGRPKKPSNRLRTAWFQIRCTPAFKAELLEMVQQGGHADLPAMFEAMVARERKRLGRKGTAPPR